MAVFYCPAQVGAGALYQVCQDSRGGVINVYRSADGGGSWQLQDGGNSPSRSDPQPTAGMFFDGNHTIYVCWIPAGGPQSGHTGPVALKTFDTNTNTWGATFGTAGAPSVYIVDQIFLRPDGSLACLLMPHVLSGFVVDPTVYVFSNGAWSAGFPLYTNLPAGLSGEDPAAVMDSTGRIHCFITSVDVNGVANDQLVYQLFKPDNTLGASSSIQTGTPNQLPEVAQFQPCVSGDNVLIGLADAASTYATVAVGTPLSAPVFTVLGSPGIDPDGPGPVCNPPTLPIFAPAFAADSSGIYAIYGVRRPDFSVDFKLCYNPNPDTPLVGWTTSIVGFVSENVPASLGIDPEAWDFIGIARVANQTFVSAQGALNNPDIGAEDPTQFWLGNVVISPPAFTGGGASGGRFRCCPPASRKMQQIIEGAELVRKALTKAECWPWDHVVPPRGAVPLGPYAQSIASPAPAPGVRTAILSYVVPTGFKLVLHGILQDVLGVMGFNPGDALWTVDQMVQAGSVQGSPVEGLASLPVPLGSFTFGRYWKFPRAFEFSQLVLLRSTVTNVNLGTGAPVAFVSALDGYLVPVQ